MTSDQRDAWKRAIAERAKNTRVRRGKHRKQDASRIRVGMIRRQPPEKQP